MVLTSGCANAASTSSLPPGAERKETFFLMASLKKSVASEWLIEVRSFVVPDSSHGLPLSCIGQSLSPFAMAKFTILVPPAFLKCRKKFRRLLTMILACWFVFEVWASMLWSIDQISDSIISAKDCARPQYAHLISKGSWETTCKRWGRGSFGFWVMQLKNEHLAMLTSSEPSSICLFSATP